MIKKNTKKLPSYEQLTIPTIRHLNHYITSTLHHLSHYIPQSLHYLNGYITLATHHFHSITSIIALLESLHHINHYNFNNTSLQHYITSIITPPQSLHHLNTTSPQSLHHFLTCCSSYFCKLVVTPRTAVNQSMVHLVSRQGRFLFRHLWVCSFHVRSSPHC